VGPGQIKTELYIEHGGDYGVRGAELKRRICRLWFHDHQVDLIHHRPPLTGE
jgi:hypothetical protein